MTARESELSERERQIFKNLLGEINANVRMLSMHLGLGDRERTPAASRCKCGHKLSDHSGDITCARCECGRYAAASPAEPARDVVEEMCAAYVLNTERYQPCNPKGMTSAYQIARQRCEEEMLATLDKLKKPNNLPWQVGYNTALSDIKERLSQPVETLQEKVATVLVNFMDQPGSVLPTQYAAEIITLVRAELEGK